MFATEINYLAMVVAGLATYAIGALWYSPVLFMNEWMKVAGLDKKKNAKVAQSQMVRMYTLGLIANMIAAFVLARLLVWTRAGDDLVGALKIGGWLWLGFIAVWMINSWLYESKQIKYFVINSGYALVTVLVGAAILTLWR